MLTFFIFEKFEFPQDVVCLEKSSFGSLSSTITKQQLSRDYSDPSLVLVTHQWCCILAPIYSTQSTLVTSQFSESASQTDSMRIGLSDRFNAMS